MKKITSLSSIVFAIFLMVLWLMPAPSAYAAGNTFYLTPGSSQMNIGTSF